MKKAFVLLLILFLSNIPSLYYSWYIKFSWIDVVQHFLGGFFMAMFMVAYLREHMLKKAFIKNMLIVVGATAFIGVVWEFSEYIANQTLIDPFYRWFGIKAYFMGDLKDTMADLSLDISGAILLYLLHLFWRRNSHQEETLA